MTLDSPVFPHKCALKILCGARAILASYIIFMRVASSEQRVNRSGRSWYQIQSMNVLRVFYGLDFAYSPRGPRPRPLKFS